MYPVSNLPLLLYNLLILKKKTFFLENVYIFQSELYIFQSELSILLFHALPLKLLHHSELRRMWKEQS